MSDTETGAPAQAQAAHEQGAVDSAHLPLGESSETQATRARMQGGGVGQREINAQRDPTRTVSQDQFSSTDGPAKGGDSSPSST